jgi:hypothetical protein
MLQKGPGKWYMDMTLPYPSHTLKSEIRPKNLSDDSYDSDMKMAVRLFLAVSGVAAGCKSV